MIIAAIIFSVLYFLLLLWFLTGWLKLKPSVNGIAKPEIRFSIIVPARNEEANILKTIEDLAWTGRCIEKINQYYDIRRIIDEITDMLRDMNTLSPEMHNNTNFEALIKAIDKKIQTDSTN